MLTTSLTHKSLSFDPIVCHTQATNFDERLDLITKETTNIVEETTFLRSELDTLQNDLKTARESGRGSLERPDFAKRNAEIEKMAATAALWRKNVDQFGAKWYSTTQAAAEEGQYLQPPENWRSMLKTAIALFNNAIAVFFALKGQEQSSHDAINRTLFNNGKTPAKRKSKAKDCDFVKISDKDDVDALVDELCTAEDLQSEVRRFQAQLMKRFHMRVYTDPLENTLAGKRMDRNALRLVFTTLKRMLDFQRYKLTPLKPVKRSKSESHDLRVAIGNSLDFLGHDALVLLIKKYVYHYHALSPVDLDSESAAFIFVFMLSVDNRNGAVALTMLLSYAVAICFGSIPSIIVLRRIAAWQIANGAAADTATQSSVPMPPTGSVELPIAHSLPPVLTRVEVLGDTATTKPATNDATPGAAVGAFVFDIREFDGVDFCVYAPTVGSAITSVTASRDATDDACSQSLKEPPAV
jgi:hypothetical protein